MHEGRGDYLKYLKRGWNRKEGRGHKDLKKVGQAGSMGGCLKEEGGLEPPYELYLFIFKFTLKYMLENVYINKIHARQCLYISLY